MVIKKYMWLCLGLGALGACQPTCQKDQALKESATNIKAEEAAASVNGLYISKQELDVLHERAVEKFKRTNRPVSAELERDMRGSILRKMIDDEIVHQKVKAEGVNVDRFERVKAFEDYVERMGGQKVFKIFLERQGLTEEQVQKTVLADVQRDKLIEKLAGLDEPSMTEMKSHYEANKRLYTMPEMVHARHILLKLSANDPQEKAELVLKKAHEIVKEAQGSVSFESLVTKYSEGPSVKTGGDLGFFSRGKMVKAFEDAAFNAPLKKAVGPVKTEYGYHIIYVEEKSPERTATFEEVRDRVADFVKRHKRARKSEEILSQLRKKAKVKIIDSSMTQEEYADYAKLTSEPTAKK